jgi:hypothetical protein
MKNRNVFGHTLTKVRMLNPARISTRVQSQFTAPPPGGYVNALRLYLTVEDVEGTSADVSRGFHSNVLPQEQQSSTKEGKQLRDQKRFRDNH